MRDTFNVPYDLFAPLLIKLLITFGCYRHQGDIPQVLSAAWAQKNPHRGTSLSPPVFLGRSCSHLHTTVYRIPSTVSSPKQHYFWSVITHWNFKVSFLSSQCGIQMVPFITPHHSTPTSTLPLCGTPLWLHCRGFCSPSSCLEMRTRHGPLRAFTRYCYVSKPIN